MQEGSNFKAYVPGNLKLQFILIGIVIIFFL